MIGMRELDPGALAIIEPRLKINLPPAGFDPLTASARQCAKHFLPPRPDAAQAPLAHRLWMQAMSPPLTFPAAPKSLAAFLGSIQSAAGPARMNGSGSLKESSQNWSGGFVRPRDFNPMVLVQGEWTVPEVSAPAGLGDGVTASSIWVGLDGHDPASRSLPQIGTGQYVSVTGGVARPLLFAWWEWWDRDDPLAQGQIVLRSFPVRAGDRIYAQVQALTPTLVSLFIRNMTTGLALPLCYAAPPGRRGVKLRVEGRTAEWIVERPSMPGAQPPRHFPLADYGSAVFRACNAASGTAAALREGQLQRARLLEMNVWDAGEPAGALVSAPERVGRDSLRVRYVA
jgi:hypothetical protein